MKLLKRILKWTGIVMLVVVLVGRLSPFVTYSRSSNDCQRNTDASTQPIKAISKCEYGSPDVLTLRDIEKPSPRDTQIYPIAQTAEALRDLEQGHARRKLVITL